MTPELTTMKTKRVSAGSLRPDDQLRITRPILSQPNFDQSYGLIETGPPLTPWQEIKRIGRKQWHRNVSSNRCGARCVYSYLSSWFPALDWVPKYDYKKLIIPDFVAGITVGIMNIPQGMAYALLAGLPAVCGLYTSFIPTLFYFAMGTSRQCSLGTFAVISMMTSKIILAYAPARNPEDFIVNGTMQNQTMIGAFTEDEMKAIKVGAAAGLLVGFWQLLFGILGFGALTVYLSDQLVQGFTCSASIHVFSSQLTNVFGVKGLPEYQGLFKIARTYYRFFSVIHTAHTATMLISLVSIILLISIKYGLNGNKRIKAFLRIPIPAELIVVIIGAAVSYSFNFEQTFHVAIVKKVPRGMPPVTMPNFDVMPSIIGETFALAVVTFAITVTLGMVFASKHNYSIVPNQEFKALGVGNIVGAWFQCFPSGASLARSAVQDDAGGRTQIVSLIQCTIVLIVIMAIGPLLEPLPKAVLGSIVMVALFHLLEQVVELWHLWKLSFVDWTIFLVVFLAVIILDVDIGVAIGVAYSIMTVMFRLQKPKVRQLGRISGTDLYKPVDIYSKACPVPNVKIVRVDAPIYFANAAYIKTRLYNLAGLNNAMSWLRKEKDDTEDADTQQNKYAFTNTLAMDDDEPNATEQFQSAAIERRISRVSTMLAVSKIALKADDELEAETNKKEERDELPEFHLIIDCSEVCFVDVTGTAFIKKTAIECKTIGVELLLANTNKPVRDVLTICGVDAFVQPHQMFVTVHDAVLYAVNVQATSWGNTSQLKANESVLSTMSEVPENSETKM